MDESEAISKPKSHSSKICIVCAYSSLDIFYYAVFIVDLKSQVGDNNGAFITTVPTLLIDRESLGGNPFDFCLLNSTLYMIEFGYRALGDQHRKGKSVYIYNLSPALLESDILTSTKKSCILERNMLGRDDMLRPKIAPASIPTPDGNRFLVFSTQIGFWSSDSVANDEIDFEVYNPVDGGWKKLPSLQVQRPAWRDILKSPSRFVIKTYAFVSNSVFLIQTDVAGMFTLDIDNLDRGWREEFSFAGAERIPFNNRFFLIDKLCFALSGAYDISGNDGREDTFDYTRACRFPTSSFDDDFKHEGPSWSEMHTVDMVYNNRGEGEGGGVVYLHTGVNEENMLAHMLLDVCSFNLEKYKRDGESEESVRLETNIVKSFKFVLNTHLYCWKFVPYCLSPIGAARTD